MTGCHVSFTNGDSCSWCGLTPVGAGSACAFCACRNMMSNVSRDRFPGRTIETVLANLQADCIKGPPALMQLFSRSHSRPRVRLSSPTDPESNPIEVSLDVELGSLLSGGRARTFRHNVRTTSTDRNFRSLVHISRCSPGDGRPWRSVSIALPPGAPPGTVGLELEILASPGDEWPEFVFRAEIPIKHAPSRSGGNTFITQTNVTALHNTVAPASQGVQPDAPWFEFLPVCVSGPRRTIGTRGLRWNGCRVASIVVSDHVTLGRRFQSTADGTRVHLDEVTQHALATSHDVSRNLLSIRIDPASQGSHLHGVVEVVSLKARAECKPAGQIDVDDRPLDSGQRVRIEPGRGSMLRLGGELEFELSAERMGEASPVGVLRARDANAGCPLIVVHPDYPAELDLGRIDPAWRGARLVWLPLAGMFCGESLGRAFTVQKEPL